jgi:hypothetical protein
MASLDTGEVLGLRLRHLADLPRPSTLTLELDLADGSPATPPAAPTSPPAASPPPSLVHMTTSRQRAAALVESGAIALTPVEYETLAVALADGRLTRTEALAHLRRKLAQPGHRLTRAALLGPVRAPDGGGDAWTVERLCEALRARVVAVEVEG